MLNRVLHHYSSPSNSAFATSVAVPINVTIILNKINYIYFIRNITLRISNYSSILINNIKRNSYNYKLNTRLLHPFPHYSNDITKKSLFRVYRARKNFRIEKRRGGGKKLGSSLRKERKKTVVLYRGCTGRMKRKARLVKTTFRLFKNVPRSFTSIVITYLFRGSIQLELGLEIRGETVVYTRTLESR